MTGRSDGGAPAPAIDDPFDGAGEPAVLVAGVSKIFGAGGDAVLALDSISLAVHPGDFVTVLGASGCGKSTLLNLIAGLDTPTAGTVAVTGSTALMFQQDALFPWLSAQRNVELALRKREISRLERRDRARELLALVHLSGFESSMPHELSGGMRQRVSLARALAQESDVLLMDEPFGALDTITRDVMHDELEQIWSERDLTIVFVTHNVREAVRLGDRVVLLSSRPGRVAAAFRVGLDHPRDTDDAAVVELTHEITGRLREEVRSHGRA